MHSEWKWLSASAVSPPLFFSLWSYWWIKETSYRWEEIIPAKTDSLAMKVLYFLTVS